MFELSDSVGEVSPDQVRAFIDLLARSNGPGDDSTRISMLDLMRQLGNVADGYMTGMTADFARSQREVTHLTEKRERVDRSIAAQVGMACRESPHRGGRRVGLAMALTTEMPHTYSALRTGRIDEWRATIIARETACISREDRGKIDAHIGADLDRIEMLSVKKLENEIRSLAYEADRETFVRARERAVKDRQVSVRPLPDGMARLSATVPLVEGVAVYASLHKAADTAKNAGDERSRGAIMVDTLLDRVIRPAATTGVGVPTPAAAAAPVVPIGVNLTISDATLLADGNEPAQCEHFGPIPADLARQLIAAADAEGLATLRRVYTNTSGVVTMESRSRCFPPGLARLIRIRDRTCRMPYCDAPIRHIDHIVPHADGGETDLANGQGFCEGCNHAKQPAGWVTRVVGDGSGRHLVETVTPTGHMYRSIAPLPPRPLAARE